LKKSPSEIHFADAVDTYNEEIASVYERCQGAEVEVWTRSVHSDGFIAAYRVGGKEYPVHCFAVFVDGKIIRDRHENLVGLFGKGDGTVAIGNKRKYHDKF
jgi:hypothetical protein